MTVLYIDTEHDRIHNHPTAGAEHRARLTETTARIEQAGAEPCDVLRFDMVSLAWIEQAALTAIVIGGSSADWSEYDFSGLGGLLDVIRTAPAPILGICAGHQLIGRAHNAAWGPLGALPAGETDADPDFAPGRRKEQGFQSVDVDAESPLFSNVAPVASFFQRHYWQLEEVPAGFLGRARSRWSPIQAIERIDRRVFGVQFHPERYDAAHPHGAVVLRNFFALTRDIARGMRAPPSDLIDIDDIASSV